MSNNLNKSTEIEWYKQNTFMDVPHCNHLKKHFKSSLLFFAFKSIFWKTKNKNKSFADKYKTSWEGIKIYCAYFRDCKFLVTSSKFVNSFTYPFLIRGAEGFDKAAAENRQSFNKVGIGLTNHSGGFIAITINLRRPTFGQNPQSSVWLCPDCKRNLSRREL